MGLYDLFVFSYLYIYSIMKNFIFGGAFRKPISSP